VLGQAIYVVTAYTLSSAPNRNRYPYSFGYALTYADAQIDLLGRGWEGFHETKILDLSTRLATRHLYNQEFPFTGQEAAVRYESDGVLLKLDLTTYLSRSSAIFPQRNSVEVLKTGVLNYTYTDGNFDYATARVFADRQADGSILWYDPCGNNTREAWLGYVAYIDPETISTPTATNKSGNPILPTLLDPLASDEIVYHYHDFINDQYAWVLGLLAHDKVSSNAVDSCITTFNKGDLTLSATTYSPGTYNKQSVSNWDDANGCFQKTTYQYDDFGNRMAESLPGGRTTTYTYEIAYHTYLDQTISPKNAQGTSLVSYAGYDPRFGVQVAQQDENGYVSIVDLDGFGRKSARQGPVPSDSQSDINLVTRFVTGSSRDRFMAAKVLSLETIAYLDDGLGGVYSEHLLLQQFPDSDARSFVCTQKFVDGLSKERLVAVDTGGAGAGKYSVATFEYRSDGKALRKGIPSFSSDPASETSAF